MPWGTTDAEKPAKVTEDRVREIVREELAVLAAKKLTEDA